MSKLFICFDVLTPLSTVKAFVKIRCYAYVMIGQTFDQR